MKRLLTAAAILLTMTVAAQQKKDSLTADTKFISVNDLLKYSDGLKDKVTARQYEVYSNMLNAVLKEAVEAYQKEKEKPKK